MKGKLLQKFIAVVLVFCMTATNLIFAAASTVYALAGTSELEGGNIVFEAYFKNGDQKVTEKTANISEGDNLYLSINLKAGKLQNAKVKIDNANFTIEDQKVNNKYINNINTKENIIVFNELNYTDSEEGAIEIELPIKFEEATQIPTSYFEMENQISLSGTYKNSSENGKNIQSDVIKTKLKWDENWAQDEKPLNYDSDIEKIIYLNNKTIVQATIKSEYTSNYFPKETETVTVSVPKVNDITPSYTVLVDGDKLDLNEITDSVTTQTISFTNNFKTGENIIWNKSGNEYKVIYVYDGLAKLEEQIRIDTNIETTMLNNKLKESGKTWKSSNIEKGTIASVKAKPTSGEIYKGYMYANSEETTYSEQYNMEISYVDGVTSVLELQEDNFKTQNGGAITTNSKTEYKEIKISKENLVKTLGTKGSLKIIPENKELNEITINSTTTADAEGNIVINYDRIRGSHNVAIQVISAQNEGTLKFDVKKAIKGNAGYEKETLKTINAIETTVKSYTEGIDSTSTATVATELKETKTEASITMNNNNILSATNKNNIEFVVTLKTGTMDTDLLNAPTVKINLPEEVVKTEITADSSALYVGGELKVDSTQVVDNGKGILVKLNGEQFNYDNKFMESIKILVYADITLDNKATSKDTKIYMQYTNENSPEKEYTSSINVTISNPELDKKELQKQENKENPETPETPETPENSEVPENPTTPETPEQQQQPLAVTMTAQTGNVQLKDGDEIYAGQTIRYTYVVKNTTDKDINNIKFTINHENINMFEEQTEEQPDSLNPGNKTNFTIEKELEDKNSKEFEIGTIKAGKAKRIAYQVRVKQNVDQIKNTVTVKAEGIEEFKIEMANKVKQAELQLELISNVAKEYPVVKDQIFQSEMKIKNTSDQKLKNITVTMSIPKSFEYKDLYEIGKTGNYTILEKDNNKLTFEINELAAGTTKDMILSLNTVAEKLEKDMTETFKYEATVNKNTYYSNDVTVGITEKIESELSARQTANIEEDTLSTGDKLNYTIRIKNTSDNDDTIIITDNVPEAAVIKNAYIVSGDNKTNIENIKNNTIVAQANIKAGETISLNIETQIDESKTGREKIENYATIIGNYLNEEVKTNTISYKLEANIKEEKQDEENKNDNPNSENGNDKENHDENTQGTETNGNESEEVKTEIKESISGIAWIDQNENGIRESNEKKLSGIKVSLANIQTGKYVTDDKGNKIEVTTNENGEYIFDNISDGKYIVIFTFDNVKYRNTEYRTKNATEYTNSDIITSKLSASNDDINYGITDTLELNGRSLKNIDAGFIENEIFDLTLHKYITKVIVQNAGGTVVKQYDKQQLAKLEIDAKNLAGSTVLVEYTLEITNIGEVPGYASELIDYIPKDLTFSSEMNKDWYISTDGNIHSTALSNKLIQPGKSISIPIILVKTMTENNTGLTLNKAQIIKASNELSIPDRDLKTNTQSTTSQTKPNEAELIVSVRTGVEYTIGMIVGIIALTATGIIVYTKKRKEARHE